MHRLVPSAAGRQFSGGRSAATLMMAVMAAIAMALLVAGCDSAVEPGPAGDRPPEVSNIAIAPDTVVISESSTGCEDITTSLHVAADAHDAERALDRVPYAVLSPQRGAAPIAEGQLASVGDSRYAADTTITLPGGGIGRYTVLVYAVDGAEQLSNEVRGGLILTGEGSPPVIEEVIAPSQINPPTTLRFVVVVSDPNCLSNIAEVVVTLPNGQQVALFDDGETSGDEAAGDGRYTATFNVPGEQEPVTQTFIFQAFDRTGLASDTVAVDVTVVE